jgi:hypothetical protein
VQRELYYLVSCVRSEWYITRNSHRYCLCQFPPSDHSTFTTTTSAGSEIGIERTVSAATDIVVGFEGLILIFIRQVRANDISSTYEGLWILSFHE